MPAYPGVIHQDEYLVCVLHHAREFAQFVFRFVKIYEFILSYSNPIHQNLTKTNIQYKYPNQMPTGSGYQAKYHLDLEWQHPGTQAGNFQAVTRNTDPDNISNIPASY